MSLKILHLIDSGGLYGAEKMLLALVAEQLKMGLRPMILSAGVPGIAEKALEAEAHRLDLPITPWRMRPGFNPYDSMTIIQWARIEKYELFHSHGYKFNVLIGLLPKFIRKIPFMTTLHGYLKAPRFSKSWVYEMLDRLALKRMSGVVLVAEAIEKDIPGSILLSGRVFVIPNGVDVEKLVKASEGPVFGDFYSVTNSHSPLLLGVGRLSREKGFDRLIYAMRTVKNVYPRVGLIIIGEGWCRAELEQLVSKIDLSKSVHLPGYCATVPALMARSDLLCIPSRTEGLPIALLEAMAVGVPVCASDVGEIGSVLGHGKGGKISCLGSPDQLAQDILQSLDRKEEMAEAVEWSKQRISLTYSASNMARQYAEVYEKVLG
jgi:glycosyltransferase involved in cell wall biosynthesis